LESITYYVTTVICSLRVLSFQELLKVTKDEVVNASRNKEAKALLHHRQPSSEPKFVNSHGFDVLGAAYFGSALAVGVKSG